MNGSVHRGVVRATAFLSVTGVLVALYLCSWPFGAGARATLRRLWSRSVCFILGLRVVRTGEPFRACPTLYVANHVSYLDVVCIASFADATFIAKSEVAGWPFFGFIAKLAGTMFVRRHWRQALVQRNALAAQMREGGHFVLFGEGTSTNGLDVKPFKTSLLSVAEPWVVDRPVAVQPVTLVYLRFLDGTLVDATNTDLYAWWGSADMLGHLWRMLKLPGAVVEVHFGPPVLSWAVSSRKVLGRELHAQVLHTMRASRGQPLAAATGTAQIAPAMP
jgi:lyso-ornithine lipid O-acyltransferase